MLMHYTVIVHMSLNYHKVITKSDWTGIEVYVSERLCTVILFASCWVVSSPGYRRGCARAPGAAWRVFCGLDIIQSPLKTITTTTNILKYTYNTYKIHTPHPDSWYRRIIIKSDHFHY